MTERRYRLGNQPEKYMLSEAYSGWVPEDQDSWEEFRTRYFLCNASERPGNITVVSPDGKKKISLIIHQGLSKDAFPLSFFGEERSAEWTSFLMVSEVGSLGASFLIPMH